MREDEFEITSRELGFNVYRFTVPIVSTDVLITANGVLSTTPTAPIAAAGRTAITATSRRTGEILSEA